MVSCEKKKTKRNKTKQKQRSLPSPAAFPTFYKKAGRVQALRHWSFSLDAQGLHSLDKIGPALIGLLSLGFYMDAGEQSQVLVLCQALYQLSHLRSPQMLSQSSLPEVIEP